MRVFIGMVPRVMARIKNTNVKVDEDTYNTTSQQLYNTDDCVLAFENKTKSTTTMTDD